ncbi:hypothetical protein PBY51_024747 [Eleginops maclovinus]|uniref:Uncharacterized protein n=1 Tax=Eleginops maclovinus TaxID=56733 RepID=A0AAN8APC0_ELEMC|nr:hypothetical protein PBY51_024747 [Eleginops maclovinus]
MQCSANRAGREYSACKSYLSPNNPAKRTKKEETQSNKPDLDTSSWLETFLIINSCLWVTRPATQHKAAPQLSVYLVFHFQGRPSLNAQSESNQACFASQTTA